MSSTTAKLLSMQEPGWKKKQISHEADYGEISTWSLTEDKDDPHRLVHVVVNDILFALGSPNQVARAFETDAVPKTQGAFVEMMRENWRASTGPMATHKLAWEALELPMEERQAKVDALAAARRSRESAREEHEKSVREKEALVHRERFERAASLVREGGRVDGKDLLFLAKELKVPVQPQTAGALAHKVEWVDPTRASMLGKTKSTKVWEIYRAVNLALAGRQ